MKRIVVALATILALFVGGCASHGDYYKSVDAANAKQVEIAQAQAQAEAARYMALAKIAESGDATAKVAATMALALGNGQRPAVQSVTPQQPQASEALQWAQVFSAPVSQLGMGYFNMRTSMNASNNSTTLGISTNQTFGQMNASLGTAVSGALQAVPSPVVVTQPAPLVVTQPAPLVVQPTVVNPLVVSVPTAP